MHLFFVFLFFTLFSFCMGSVFRSAPAYAETLPASTQNNVVEDDFAYYKKYGKTSKAWNDFVKKGFEAYSQQNCESAIAFLKQAMGAGSKDPIVLFKLAACTELSGSAYSALQYYKEAEDGLKTLPAPHRYTNDFYEAYGRALYLNDKTDEALPYLTKAAEVGSPSFFLFYLLGSINLSKQQNQVALEYFRKALDQSTEGASPAQLSLVHAQVGKAYLEAKDWNKAIQYFDLALQASPEDPELKQLRYKASEMKRQEELFKMMNSVRGK